MVSRVWKTSAAVVVVLWIAAMGRLFIADVWDESNGLVAFGNPSLTASDVVRTILKTPLPFWRPVPTIFAGLVLHFLQPAIGWILLRAVNLLSVLAALAIFIRVLRDYDSKDPRRDALFITTCLVSGGAIIVAGWYANIFDASVIFLMAVAMWLMARGRPVGAGIIFGSAFFCKETAALALPLLLLLVAIDRLRWRDAMRAAIPTAVLGGVYFVLRQRVVSFGSSADTHQFHVSRIGETAIGLSNSFWTESLWGNGPTIIGFVWFAFALIAMRGWRAKLAWLALIGVTTLMYLELFGVWQDHELIHYLMFVGRLYFIPVVLTLFVFALDRRWWAMAVLAIPLFIGAVITYTHFERFQRSYRNIYRYAAGAPRKPVRIYFPMKTLDDPRRGIQIGDFPDSALKIDPMNGKLVARR